jgi:hypothetical protein
MGQWARAMETEADKLRHDLQRFCYLLGRITDQEAVEVLMELIGEAVLCMTEIDQIDTATDE